jgi:Rgg/GadR/MutR family transcriptional activator
MLRGDAMETYGATIRQIRLSKGFSRKEIYTGILSKSFAIDFEKGLYDIKFNLMLKILERLMISVDELLLIHSQYKTVPCHEPLLDVNLERIKNDPLYSLEMEKQLCEEMKTDKTSSKKLQYAEIIVLKCLYSNPDYQNSLEYQTAKNDIQKYLFDVETWTLSEFRIFSDMCFLFEDSDIKTALFLTAWDTLEKYKAHPDYQIYLSHLLVNNLYQLICSRQYVIAKKAIDKLQALTVDPNMLSWKVPMLYYDGLLNYATGKQQKGLMKIEKAKQIYHLCGNEFMVEQMKTGLKAVQTLGAER